MDHSLSLPCPLKICMNTRAWGTCEVRSDRNRLGFAIYTYTANCSRICFVIHFTVTKVCLMLHLLLYSSHYTSVLSSPSLFYVNRCRLWEYIHICICTMMYECVCVCVWKIVNLMLEMLMWLVLVKAFGRAVFPNDVRQKRNKQHKTHKAKNLFKKVIHAHTHIATWRGY